MQAPERVVDDHQYGAQHDDPDGVEVLELFGNPREQMPAENPEVQVHVALREQIQRCGHLLIEDEKEDRLDDQYEGRDDARTFVPLAGRYQLGEYSQDRGACQVDTDAGDRFTLQNQN